MARAVVVAACCLVAPINLSPALADAASDRAMATRYEQSAQAGDDDAQFYLGALYSAGVGRPRSDQDAFRWFSRATDQGHAHSMLIVAGLYASGRGVTKDSVKAYSWAYIVASASKVDEDRNGARQLMSLLMKRMTSDEIGRAVVAARAWRAVRTGSAGKAPYIESAGDTDQPTQAAAPPPPPPPRARGRAAAGARRRGRTCDRAARAVHRHDNDGSAQGHADGTVRQECQAGRSPRPDRPGSVRCAQALRLLILGDTPMKLGHLIATGILAIAAAGAGYYAYSNFLYPPLVTTSYASVAPVSEAVYGTGTVEPERWAKVVPLQRRRLVELCRCEGQVVRAGQVLGRQDDAEERSALDQMEINRGQLERDLARAEKDRDKSDAARTEYEQRWTKLEEAKSRIAAQKVHLDSLLLKAPLDGMVLRRDGEVGEIAGPTDVLFWVGPPAPMQVVAEVNEEEINRIASGQKAFLRSEAFPGRALRATVSQITPKGDPTRKTFRVYLRLPQDTPLRIGMSVEANIIFREKPSAIVVPAEAIAGDWVQMIDDGQARRVPIKVGIRGNRNTEIIGDIVQGHDGAFTRPQGPCRWHPDSHRQQLDQGRGIRCPQASRPINRSQRPSLP